MKEKQTFNLVVTRDNELDTDYLRQKRVEATHAVVQSFGRNILDASQNAGKAIVRKLGEEILLSYAGAFDMLHGTDTITDTRELFHPIDKV